MNRKIIIWFYLFISVAVRTISSATPGQYVVSGHVVDAETGRALALANITLHSTGAGQSSDNRGHFVFTTFVNSSDTLHISYMGYKPQVIPVSFTNSDSLYLNILLQPVVLEMPEISVSATRFLLERRLIAMDPTARSFTPKQIALIPQVGFADIYRALQKQQGIVQSNEASPQLYVRGGSMDQNLVMLDGAPVYYPFHFLGIGSSFNSDALGGVTVSPGGFSTYFGNRLSSVIAMQSRQPQKDVQGAANLQVIGADATLCGKLGNQVGWLASYRTSFFDLAQKLGVKQIPYSFTDYVVKLAYDPSLQHHLQVTLFANHDNLNDDGEFKGILNSSTDLSQTEYTQIVRDNLIWQNRITSAQWDYRPSRNTAMHLTAYHSGYDNDYNKQSFLEFPDNLNAEFFEDKESVIEVNRTFNRDNQTETDNRFTETGIKYSLDLELGRWFWLAGIEHSRYNADYSWNHLYTGKDKYHFKLFFDYAPDSLFHYERSFQHTAGFLETTVQIADSLSVRPGVRMTRWNFSTNTVIEPRFNIRYAQPNWQITAAAGRFSQGIATSLEEGLIGFLELYFPVETGGQIETANHYILDMSRTVFATTRLHTTLYYKTFDNQLKITGANPVMTPSTGEAWGAEFALTTEWRKWQVTGQYTLSNTQRTYNKITWDANSDQRHRVQCSLQKRLRGNVDVYVYWELHSGQPYWPGAYYGYLPYFLYPISRPGLSSVYFAAYEMDLERDRIRYPYYHRLDMQISITKKYRTWTMIPYFSFYNVYARKNVLYYRTCYITHSFENGVFFNPKLNRDPFILPFIPSFGIKFEF